MAYGIRINNNSNNEIFGYNTTASHFITQGSSTINKGSSVTHSCEGMEADNGNTVGVIVTSTNNYDSQYITVDRFDNGTCIFSVDIYKKLLYATHMKIKKKQLAKLAFRVYMIYSITADMIVIGGIVYIIFF